ncbi:hypothetical protein [Rhodovulum steppense]|uniref:NYN domain-containing protein n=1 Tax=Rhodovulum steppense TaxID=540251 RepID=A0A4R1Z3Z3_9RHOB|nr:hypothetical protein [Rhodovulum steppense]TCM88013.1 hypothetical protein EV216_10123 [Rhodovulum steppense]
MFQGSAIGRVAVFVDGDNVPAPHAPAILTAAREWGEPHVLRTYGQAQNLTPWQEVPGFRFFCAGLTNSASAFRSACSEFIELDAASPPVVKTSNGVPAPAPAKTEPMPTGPAIGPFDRKIRETILAAPEKGMMEITRLSAELHKLHGVRIGSQPEKTWRGYLGKRPNLYLLDPKGPNACVRLRAEGWPAG